MSVGQVGLGQITGIVTIVLLLVLLFAVSSIFRRIRRSPEMMLLHEIAKAVQNGDLEPDENQPKSIGGMDSIILPKILKDFPELNWNEMKKMIEDGVLENISGRSLTSGRVYQTAIQDYRNTEATAVITTRTSASYIDPAKARAPKGNDKGSSGKVQTVFETELVYVLDQAKTQGSAVGLVCPKCGAPVSGLGRKICAYCGAGLVPVSMKLWKIGRMIER